MLATPGTVDRGAQTAHILSQRPWCRERLRGLVLSVLAGQASANDEARFHRLRDEYLDFYIASAPRTREKRFPVLAAYLSTGSAGQAAKLAKISRRTAQDWVDDFFRSAGEHLDGFESALDAFRREDRIRRARDEMRSALRDFLDAYCSAAGCGTVIQKVSPAGARKTDRPIKMDRKKKKNEPRIPLRGTVCVACCTRRGIFGRPGWGG